MQKFINDFFTPFSHINKKKENMIVIGWVTILMVMWFTLKFPFFPTPYATWNEFIRMVKEESLLAELWSSLKLCIISMIVGTLISALLTYISPIRLLNPISKFCTKIRYLSPMALAFFFTILSPGGALQVNIMVFSISVFFITSFMSAIKLTEEEYKNSRTLGLNKWETLLENVIYGKLDILIETMAQTFAIAYIMLPSVELMVRANGGIATLLATEAKYFKLDGVIAIMTILILIGIGFDYMLQLLKIVVCPYKKFENNQ